MNDCWGLSCNFPLINDFISFNIFSYQSTTDIVCFIFNTKPKGILSAWTAINIRLTHQSCSKEFKSVCRTVEVGCAPGAHASPQEPKRFAWSDGNWIFKMIQNNVVMVKLTIWQFQCIYSNLRISNLQDFPREHVPGPSISLVSLEFA